MQETHISNTLRTRNHTSTRNGYQHVILNAMHLISRKELSSFTQRSHQVCEDLSQHLNPNYARSLTCIVESGICSSLKFTEQGGNSTSKAQETQGFSIRKENLQVDHTQRCLCIPGMTATWPSCLHAISTMY